MSNSAASTSASSVVSNAVIDDAIMELRRMTDMLTQRGRHNNSTSSSLLTSARHRTHSSADLNVTLDEPLSKRLPGKEKEPHEAEGVTRYAAAPRTAVSNDEMSTARIWEHLRSLEAVGASPDHRIYPQKQQLSEPSQRPWTSQTNALGKAVQPVSLMKKQPVLRPEFPAAAARALATNVRVALVAHKQAVSALRKQEIAVENIQRCVASLSSRGAAAAAAQGKGRPGLQRATLSVVQKTKQLSPFAI